jgi:hypothetical protein
LQLLFENNISIFSENLKYTVMKTFKLIDFWVSVGLIIAFLALSVITLDDTFFIGYFVVGGWQVISMIVHALTKTFTYWPGARYAYHWITLISIITMPVGSFMILIIAAPVMAVFYATLCGYEVFVKMNRRPLAILK